MTVRRARVTAMSSRLPSLSVPFLNIIVNALLPGRTVVEQESFADYGAFKWQFQAYEDEPGELPYEDWARLEGDLNAYGPGYAQAAVGHIGFVADDSACERDFCDDGEEE
jgi:hypothetical protein